MLIRQLGDVNQSLDPVGHAHKGTEGDQFGHRTRCNLSNGVGAGKDLPGVFLGGLKRQRDTLAVHIHLQNLDGNLLAHLDDFTGVLDVLPAEFGNVDETVHTTEVNKGSKVHDGGHHTLADLAFFEVGEEAGAGLALALLQQCAAGQNHVVPVLVKLQNLGFNFLSQIGGQVADTTKFNQ